MQRSGFLETLSPMTQTTAETIGTRLVINSHTYHFKENADPWNDAELDALIARGTLSKKTVLRNHGHFVCEVSDPEDYGAILSIGAGYRPYKPAGAQKPRETRQSTIPPTRQAPVSATRKRPAAKRQGPTAAPRPGKPPDAQPSFDPALG